MQYIGKKGLMIECLILLKNEYVFTFESIPPKNLVTSEKLFSFSPRISISDIGTI